jgi:hypothetical protein
VFALKNLCVRHSTNKKHVARLALPFLIDIARTDGEVAAAFLVTV